jgi:hypothetical protein
VAALWNNDPRQICAYSVEKLYFLETLKSGQKQLQWKTQMIFIV